MCQYFAQNENNLWQRKDRLTIGKWWADSVNVRKTETETLITMFCNDNIENIMDYLIRYHFIQEQRKQFSKYPPCLEDTKDGQSSIATTIC